MEFVKGMGFDLKNDVDAYSFPNFVKEMFFDSDTSMIVISGVPGKENNRGDDGKILEGKDRTPGIMGQILPSWVMAARKKELNDLAGSQRALSQGNCAPNHYWNRTTNSPDLPALSSRWSARSRSTASTPGSGTATPIPASRATASSSTTRS